MRNEVTSNTLVEKILVSYKELTKAESFLHSLIESMEKSIYNGLFNESEDFGKYAREMPRFRIFVHEADYLKTCIRKVCTGEINMTRALARATQMYNTVHEALELFDEQKVSALLPTSPEFEGVVLHTSSTQTPNK